MRSTRLVVVVANLWLTFLFVGTFNGSITLSRDLFPRIQVMSRLLTLALKLKGPSTHLPSIHRRFYTRMPTQATVQQLPSPLRDLVLAACSGDEGSYGSTDGEKKEVSDWLEKVAKGDVAKPEAVKVWCAHWT